MISKTHTQAANTRSDINEHLESIKKYASECESVVEYGNNIRTGSLCSLAAGLLENNSNIKKLYYCSPNEVLVGELAQACCTEGIEFKIVYKKTYEFDVQTDMTFIDGWHCYGQVSRELENAKNTKKYICLHDTTIDEFVSETVRSYGNCKEKAKQLGWKLLEVQRGIWPAIEEFLEKNSEWKLLERKTNNNGLTVLGRN